MRAKLILSVLATTMPFTTPLWAAQTPAGGSELVLADFNSGDKPNNIGGDFGT